MNSRLERILITLARRNAPQLLEMGLMDAPALARRLAAFNILVIVGDPGKTIQEAYPQIQIWVDGYVHIYDLLTSNLFPSFTQISANYADGELPAIIIINGAATPVVEVMAGFIAPYVVQRQGRRSVSEAEILGLMDEILDQLEAGDLPRDEYRRLRAEGAQILKEMIASPVRQLPLMRFDRAIVEDMAEETTGQPPSTAKTTPSSTPIEEVSSDSGANAAIVDKPVEKPSELPPKPSTFPETSVSSSPPAPAPDTKGSADSTPSRATGLPPIDTSRRSRRPPVPDLPDDKQQSSSE